MYHHRIDMKYVTMSRALSASFVALLLSIHQLPAAETLPVEGESGTDEADKLAKQLVNPISSLISVPFQANEDFGYGPSHNGYKFTLNIQPVIPISLTKNWNLILRTIVPVVSQHDLFYVENVPKRLNLPAQNRSQDGLSDTLQSFFFSPEKRGPFGLNLGGGAGPSLPHRNSPVSRHRHILDWTHRGDSQTGGWVNRRRVDESTLVCRHRRGSEERQPAIPAAVRRLHTEDAHDSHSQFRSDRKLE